MKTIFVKKCINQSNITKYILKTFPSLNKAILFKAIRNKDIKLNGKRISQDTKVNAGDKIEIYISDELLYNLPKKLDIIYEDENLIAVFKPQGIISNFENIDINNNENQEPSMEFLVKKYYNKSKICHRLDRNTAGILIFAKNDIAYNELYMAFKYRLYKKRIYSLCNK